MIDAVKTKTMYYIKPLATNIKQTNRNKSSYFDTTRKRSKQFIQAFQIWKDHLFY